jgi:hypothetical protein
MLIRPDAKNAQTSTFEGEPVPWPVPPLPWTHIYLLLLAFEWHIIPHSSVMFRPQACGGRGRDHSSLLINNQQLRFLCSSRHTLIDVCIGFEASG